MPRKGEPEPAWTKSYLELEAELDGEYLHAGGLAATQRLISEIGVRGSVLEIGCGTGATLRGLKQTFSLVVGMDSSLRMLSRACRKSRAHLVCASASAPAFPSATFDAVVAESVAGILEYQEVLPVWIQLLKPGGVLALNDALWREQVSPSTVRQITEWCLERFGQRMAPSQPVTVRDWVSFLAELGMQNVRVSRTAVGSPTARNFRVRCRRFLAGLRRPDLWLQIWRFRRSAIAVGDELEYWLILAEKPQAEEPG